MRFVKDMYAVDLVN